jgi:hypothetical protein
MLRGRSHLLVLAGLLAGWIVIANAQLESAKHTATVSYSRDIAPIIALNCNRCHGKDDRTWWPFNDAAGLDTRTYASLMQGTDKGPIVVPGHPEASLLLSAVRSKSDLRMPLFSPPLTENQIGTIELWIREGAHEDTILVPARTLVVSSVRREELSYVSCLPTTQSYLTLTIRNPQDKNVLQTSVQSTKWGSGYGEEPPGRWVNWSIRAAPTWPEVVNVELQINYAESDPNGTVFVIPYQQGVSDGSASTFLPSPASPPRDAYGRIRFFLNEDADAMVQIAPSVGDVSVVVSSKVDQNLGAGMNYESWDFRDGNGSIVPRGEYVAKIRLVRPGTSTRLQDIAILFSVIPITGGSK